jgi:hypothetical protein
MSGTDEKVIASPCRSLCKLDSNNICMGCFRKSVEINFWTTYSNQEKKEVIRKAEARRILAEKGNSSE